MLPTLRAPARPNRAARRARFRAGVVSLLLVSHAGACSPAPNLPEPGSPILLLTLDTTRADALSCYGVHEDVTPNLDALAAEGVLFENAYTTAPITLPSHASMLSGLYPPRHGIRDNGFGSLPESARTTAEAAREAGYQTAAFLAAVVLHADFGLDQGFDVYDMPERPAEWNRPNPPERPAKEVIDAATAWLAGRDTARPFFLWVHLYDPHGPYEPPPEFRGGRFADDPYLGEVAAMDREIGRLFEALKQEGAWDDTLVLVVGDHGEAFGEHGEVAHGAFLYEPVVRVPFLLRYPGGSGGGRTRDDVVSVVDVHPTLVQAMGAAAPAGIDGESLLSGRVAADRGVYFESYYGYLNYGWSPLSGWRDAEGKYLHSSRPQFFDVASDPEEARDLAGHGRKKLAAYSAAIARVADAPALEPGSDDGDALDEELLGGIRDLGYASSGDAAPDVPHPLEAGELPSPQDRSDVHDRILAAGGHAARKELEEAEALYRGILEENPRNWIVAESLATTLVQSGRPGQAIRVLEAAVDAGSERAVTSFLLGRVLALVDRKEEAVPHLEQAVTRSRGRSRFVKELASLLREMGREEDARELQARYPGR